MAGLQPGVEDISFTAGDGYSESFPLEITIRDEVMVAYEMNGEPLSDKHGFPARLIVPGFFGVKHVKWLASIEPVNHDFKGFWQQRGWTDTPFVKTFSRFDIPQHNMEVLGETALLGGVAFAGDRGISDVQISQDDGATWQSVDSITEPLSSYTWVIWQMTFSPSRQGEVALRVRAIDGEGVAQTAEERDSLPDGASGHHEITLNFATPPAV